MRNNKFIRLGLYPMLALCGVSAVTSCSDDIFTDPDSDATDMVCFRVAPTDWGDMADTRGASSLPSSNFVLRAAGSSDTLCVRATATPGIHVDKTGPATRGTQITSPAGITSFGCFAYVNQGGVNKFYINNEKYYRNDEGVITSDNIYYWPGSQLTFDFYNIAPYGVAGLTVPTDATAARQLEYVVPADTKDQQDLMIAVNKGVPGDNNSAVPLEFNHLLSAIKIVKGANMMNGTVKSVSFTNVYGSGLISMDTPSAWEGLSDLTSYTANVNASTAGLATGADIVGGENTLILLPQQLAGREGEADPVIMKVVFNDGTKDRELETELSGEWLMNTTYTYSLSVTPEFDLEFEQTNPTTADAHYVIVPIKIKANALNGGSYTLTSADPTICKLRTNLIGPEEQGYWPKEDTGGGDFARQESISGSTEGDVVIYAFLNENAGTSPRDVKLQLHYTAPGNTTPTLAREWTITQSCPNWLNGIGWENVEEEPEKPYGFAWTRSVTYSIEGWANLWVGFVKLFGGYKNGNGIAWGGNIFLGYTCTLDYSKVQNLSNVYSEIDGLTNTQHFISNNAANLESLEGQLESMGSITSQSGDRNESTDFAALVCLKKNACTVEKQGTGENTAYIPSIAIEDIKWFLPASGQFNGAPLTGTYWTSTAVDDNANAYIWNGSAAAVEPRMVNHKVRAARVAN